MTKITLDKKYAGRKAGDEIEASEIEIDALEAIGIVHRPLSAEVAEDPVIEQEEPAPKIPLNPPPAAEVAKDEEDHD